MCTEDDEMLLRKACEYVRGEIFEPSETDIIEESLARRRKVDNSVNEKMERAWARESVQSRISLIDDQINTRLSPFLLMLPHLISGAPVEPPYADSSFL